MPRLCLSVLPTCADLASQLCHRCCFTFVVSTLPTHRATVTIFASSPCLRLQLCLAVASLWPRFGLPTLLPPLPLFPSTETPPYRPHCLCFHIPALSQSAFSPVVSGTGKTLLLRLCFSLAINLHSLHSRCKLSFSPFHLSYSLIYFFIMYLFYLFLSSTFLPSHPFLPSLLTLYLCQRSQFPPFPPTHFPIFLPPTHFLSHFFSRSPLSIFYFLSLFLLSPLILLCFSLVFFPVSPFPIPLPSLRLFAYPSFFL